MIIWLLENGERTGPHQIYDIRDRISNEELDADTLAWYEGAEGWVKLGEVPTYSSYFKKASPSEGLKEEEKITSELIESLEKELASDGTRTNPPAFQNEPLEPVRRFFARVFDIFLYTVLLLVIKIQIGMAPFPMENSFQWILDYIPYVLLDGLALTYIGTTPGKWLLNIRLRNYLGEHIDIKTSLVRSLRVWMLGFALGTVFALIALPFSYFIASKYGKFLWDIPKNNVTQCGMLSSGKLVVFIFLFSTAFYIAKISIKPEMLPPELRKALEQNQK